MQIRIPPIELDATRVTYESDRAVDFYESSLNQHRLPQLIKLIDDFSASLAAHTSVADLGCGTGDIVDRLRHKGLTASGFDYSRKMVELARRRYGDHFHILNLLTEQYRADHRFDAVLSISVLLHVSPDFLPVFLSNSCSFAKGRAKFLLATKTGPLDPWDFRLGPDLPRRNFSHSPQLIQKTMRISGFDLHSEVEIVGTFPQNRPPLYVGIYCRDH